MLSPFTCGASCKLSAKLWRVWSKIRTAETHQLQLWDATARRIARLQCGTTALLLAVHLSYSASEDYRGNAPRDTCLGESAPVHEVERALYTAETLLVLACLLPSPVCSRGRLTLLRPCPCTHTRVRVRVPPHAHGVRTALAAQVLAWAVTSSSFAPIFAAWPYLLLSVLAVLLCAAIQVSPNPDPNPDPDPNPNPNPTPTLTLTLTLTQP